MGIVLTGTVQGSTGPCKYGIEYVNDPFGLCDELLTNYAEQAVRAESDIYTQSTIVGIDGKVVYFVLAFRFDINQMNVGNYIGKACFLKTESEKESHLVCKFLWDFADAERVEISRWVNPDLN